MPNFCAGTLRNKDKLCIIAQMSSKFWPRMLKRVTPSPPEAAQMLNADTDVASDDS